MGCAVLTFPPKTPYNRKRIKNIQSGTRQHPKKEDTTMRVHDEYYTNIKNQHGVILARWAEYLKEYSSDGHKLIKFLNNLHHNQVPQDNINAALDIIAHLPHPVNCQKQKEHFRNKNTIEYIKKLSLRGTAIIFWALAHRKNITDHPGYEKRFFGKEHEDIMNAVQDWVAWCNQFTYIGGTTYATDLTDNSLFTLNGYQATRDNHWYAEYVIECVAECLTAPTAQYAPLFTPVVIDRVCGRSFHSQLTHEKWEAYETFYYEMMIRSKHYFSPEVETLVLAHAPAAIALKAVRDEPFTTGDYRALTDTVRTVMPLDNKYLDDLMNGKKGVWAVKYSTWGTTFITEKTREILEYDGYYSPNLVERLWLFRTAPTRRGAKLTYDTHTFTL